MSRSAVWPGGLLFAAAYLLAFSGIANGGVNQWTPTGPEGGSARSVAFHPTLPGVAFTGAGASVYRTSDSGQSWTAVRADTLNGAVRIVVDPSNANRVVAVTSATLYLSNDAGQTFGAVGSPNNEQLIGTLAIAPTGGAIYVGRDDGRVFRSLDGLQWEERSTGINLASSAHRGVFDLVFDPADANSIYALLDAQGVYHTADAGLHWTLAGLLPAPALASASLKLAVDPGRPQEMLVASYGGLYASTDGGANWSLSDVGHYAWVGYHPGQPNSHVGAAVALAANGRSLRRGDRSLPWVQTGSLKVVTLEDAAFDPTNLDPVNSTLLLATTDGPLLTTDGGQTFSARPHGIRGSTAYHLTASNDGSIYAAYSSGPTGMWKRGASGADPWIPLNNSDLRSKITQPFQPLSVVVDPSNSQTLFVASDSSVVRSTDGGQSWTAPHAVFSNLITPRTLAFDPSNSDVLYAATDANGLYRTQDKGVTWFPRSATPASLDTLLIDPSAPGTLYVAPLASGSPPSPPFLYKSADGGMILTPVSGGLNTLAAALALNPANPQEVYAGGPYGTAPGLYRSANAGQSWTYLGASASGTQDLAIDPLVPTTMVAVMNAAGHGGARSVDGGVTWEPLDFQGPGGNYFVMRRVILDPRNPHIVIASAEGYGLVEFEVSPDLEVSLLSSPAIVPLGKSAPASVRVLNKGSLSASAVELTLTMPTSVTATVSTVGQGTCSAVAQVVHCSLGAMRPGVPVDVSFQINADSVARQVSWSASVAGHESDPVSANNSVTTPVSISELADVRLALAVLPTAPLDRGTAVSLAATITNAGPNAASDVRVVLPLPVGMSFQSASLSQGADPCAVNSGTVTCALGTLAASATATATFNTTVVTAGTPAVSLQATTASVDPDTTNNSVGGSLTVVNVVDGQVAITDSSSPATAGQSLQYTATLTNSGPDPMLSPVLTFTLSGAALSSATTPQGTCAVAGTTANCTLSDLSGGVAATVTVNALPASAGTATANATITFAGRDPNTANNTASRTTTVNAAPTPPSGGSSSGSSSGGGGGSSSGGGGGSSSGGGGGSSSGGGGGGGGGGGAMDLLSLLAILLTQVAWRLRPARLRKAKVHQG